MRVRENYQPYLDRVKIFLDALLPQVVDLQFTRGGSIIAAQVFEKIRIILFNLKGFSKF